MPDELQILYANGESGQTVCVLQDGRLLELYPEADAHESLVGTVLLGKVERVVPAMQAAFVRIGQPLNGFLPVKEMASFEDAAHNSFKAGDTVMVQVKKDAKGGKGAFLTRDIALTGQYLLYMPFNRHIGVSKRVANEEEREALRLLGEALSGGQFGLVMRQAALSGRESDLQAELDELRRTFAGFAQAAREESPPCVLWREPGVLEGLERDYASRYHLTMEELSQQEMDHLLTSGQIGAQLRQALGRTVRLSNGGTLVIDEREALTTVDVNSAACVRKSGKEDFAAEHNEAACAEIARQIRLRNVSGIILIDFLDMRTEQQRARVMETMRKACEQERVKTAVHGFTSLGLLEMTRKRTREPLSSLLRQTCPLCGGSGLVSTDMIAERKQCT